jgi:hypothetical protein
VEKFSVAMKGDLGWIEGEDAGDADEYDIHLRGVPVVGPCLDVHYRGIVLGHVGLAHAAHLFLPGLRRDIG